MTPLNSNNAWLNSNGNLTLGDGEIDDGSADTTNKYAKGDVFVQIPVSKCLVALGATSNYTAIPNAARTAMTIGVSAPILLNTNTTGIGASQFVLVPFDFMQRTFNGGLANGPSTSPHGFKLRSFQFNYAVYGSPLIAAPGMTFWSEVQADTATRVGVLYDAAAAVTFENPIGTTTASLPTALNTLGWSAGINITNPRFLNTNRTLLFGELNFSLSNVAGNTGGKVEVSNMCAQISVALY